MTEIKTFFKGEKKKKKAPGKVAKFSKETKEAIFKRDGGSCILCNNPGIDCHHAKFGLEKNNSDTRNNITEGVLLCRHHHDMAHACSVGEGVRRECIDYLYLLYGDK